MVIPWGPILTPPRPVMMPFVEGGLGSAPTDPEPFMVPFPLASGGVGTVFGDTGTPGLLFCGTGTPGLPFCGRGTPGLPFCGCACVWLDIRIGEKEGAFSLATCVGSAPFSCGVPIASNDASPGVPSY